MAKRTFTRHVQQASNGQWYVTLVAPNGETVNASETYTRKHDAVRAAERLVHQVASSKLVVHGPATLSERTIRKKVLPIIARHVKKFRKA